VGFPVGDQRQRTRRQHQAKLRGGHSYDTHIQITNRLYISKPEQPWLVEWVKQQAMNGIEQEYFD